MGTDTHKPGSARGNEFAGHPHDSQKPSAPAGIRPGTRSRILEARERQKRRDEEE